MTVKSSIHSLVILGVTNIKNWTNTSASNASVENSIAVLPFINLNSAELDYIPDGIAVEIVNELAKISSINVSAFTTSYLYKNQEKEQKNLRTKEQKQR